MVRCLAIDVSYLLWRYVVLHVKPFRPSNIFIYLNVLMIQQKLKVVLPGKNVVWYKKWTC